MSEPIRYQFSPAPLLLEVRSILDSKSVSPGAPSFQKAQPAEKLNAVLSGRQHTDSKGCIRTFFNGPYLTCEDAQGSLRFMGYRGRSKIPEGKPLNAPQSISETQNFYRQPDLTKEETAVVIEAMEERVMLIEDTSLSSEERHELCQEQEADFTEIILGTRGEEPLLGAVEYMPAICETKGD